MTRSTQRRIDPEQADRRFGGSISGLMNGATISGFMTIGVKWVWRFLGSRSEEWVRRRNLSLSVFAHLSPCFSRSLSLFGHCSTNELGLGFSGFVGALGCGSILPSSVLGCWCDLFSWGGSDLKWKWERKLFFALSALFYGQTEIIFSLTKFSVTVKHPLFRKSIFEISLKSKQTEP